MAKARIQPRVDRVDFYRLREDAFFESIHTVIGEALGEGRGRERRWSKLTPAQQGIYGYWLLGMEQANGGLAQFFYNRTDALVPVTQKLLRRAGSPELAEVLGDAQKVYRKRRKEFETLQPFGADGVFARMTELAKLDRAYERYAGRAAKALEKWAREHVDELVTDAQGRAIDPKFTGEVETLHPNGLAFQQATVKRGVLSGAYRRYLDDGTLEHATFYKAGEESADFWPSGQPKHRKMKRGTLTVYEWYFESGKLHKRFVSDKTGYPCEPIVVWYENGQVAEELHVKPKTGEKLGPWLKFFEDGSPRLRAEHRKGEQLVVHDAWDDAGKQIVKNGAGTFYDDGTTIKWQYDIYSDLGGWATRVQLKKGVPHGVDETYHRGVLWSRTQMKEGKPDGESLGFYDNGRVRSRTVMRNGKPVKREEFPKFDRPRPAVVINVEANEKLYRAWRHPLPEVYPAPLNVPEVERELQVPQFLQEVYERNLAGKIRERYEDWNTFKDSSTYFAMVNEQGEVDDVTWSGASAYSGAVIDVYPPLIRKLRFRPGRMAGRAVPCRVVVSVEHTFAEGV